MIKIYIQKLVKIKIVVGIHMNFGLFALQKSKDFASIF